MAKGNRKPIVGAQVSGERSPVVFEDPNAYIKKRPVWAFSRLDKEHEEYGIHYCDDIYETIITKLAAFEGMTWQAIQGTSGGRKNGTNNHFIPIEDFSPEAKRRAREIFKDGTSELFSLRFTNKERLFGILEAGVFYIIWFDRNHKVCPSNKT